MAVDPKGKFAYVVNYGRNNVSAYTIDAPNGALTQVAGSPFAAGKGPIGMAVDPTGKFAYVSNDLRQCFRLYSQSDHRRANAGGGVAVCGGPLSANAVAVDPTGKFAYVTNCVSGNVSAYTIDATSGALTPVAGSPFAAGDGPTV